MRKRSSTLEELLVSYGDSDFYGFHMPGHKRNTKLMGGHLPYKMDITEIDGFDDLHHTEGILLEAQQRAARIYGAQETFFLVNGSTSGNLSAIMACTHLGGKILVARNCHKSIYNAIYLQELTPIYLYPRFDFNAQINGEITVSQVEEALQEHPDVQAVVVVSPTYEGVVSDIKGIAAVAHQYKVPLIVDEAHGAHFGFHEYFPPNSNALGADLVIHSVHKTLPAMTQTALLHVNGGLVDARRVKKYLRMFQSSSPSYVLMASIDSCMELLEHQKEEVFYRYVRQLKNVRKALEDLKYLQLLRTETYDLSKLVISVKGTDLTSQELYDRLLQEHHLQMEMVAGTYIVAMTSIGDTKEGYARLVKALSVIDKGLSKVDVAPAILGPFPQLEQVYTSAEMARRSDGMEGAEIEVDISSKYRYLYPPGIPLVVPGERVTKEVQDRLRAYEIAGFVIESE